MKYLRLYESSEDIFKNYIDWKLVDDVIDMALDYIDEGMFLKMEVKYKNYYIYKVDYTNYKKKAFWFEDIENAKDNKLSRETIQYNIRLYDKQSALLHMKNTIELKERIRRAYPDRKIIY